MDGWMDTPEFQSTRSLVGDDQKRKKEEQTTGQKYNGVLCSIGRP